MIDLLHERWVKYPCYPYQEDLSMVFKGNDFPCYLCGEPMDDEEGEVHWLCGVMENAQADMVDYDEAYYLSQEYYQERNSRS